MPAEARGHARRLTSGKWQLRYYDRTGKRRTGGVFDTRTEALNHYRDVVDPELHGRATARRDLTLQQLADLFLERHAKVVTDRTAISLRERLARPLRTFGTVPLSDLEGMTDEVAGFAAGLPERYRTRSCPHSVRRSRPESVTDTSAGIRRSWQGRIRSRNREASECSLPTRSTRSPSSWTTGAQRSVRFAAATGLRPGEWSRVERRDLDRTRRVLSVRGTKTQRSRREVPLTTVALEAIDSLPARLDTPYVFAGVKVPGSHEPGPFRRGELPHVA